MKSIKTLAYMGAIALLSVGLMSCHKDEPENNFTDANGNYKGETVKTQFMISISEGVASSNKRFMQGADVQEAGSLAQFRGMDNIYLIPYGAQVNYVLPSTRLGKTIGLTAIPNTISATEGSLNKANSIYYTDIAIPLGTENFLFYGEAAGTPQVTSTTATDAQKHQYGIVKANNLGLDATAEKEDITFDLVSIYNGNVAPEKATDLANYLTTIANATGWSNHSNPAIVALYTSFTEMTAGSSNSIQSLVQDLYNTLKLYQETQSSEDAVVNTVLAKINEGVDVVGSARPYTLTLKENLAGYPANINLPDGAAQVKWADNAFSVVFGNITIGDLSTPALSSYVYPPSLMYYAQSTIKTSKESRKEYYDGVNSWGTILSKYEDGGRVLNTTQSVALEASINYGVGLLETKVAVKDGVEKFIDSEGHEIVKENSIENIFDWTAMLIGGQKSVNYDFTVGSADATYTIYDNKFTAVSLTKTLSEPNYTLVFSTKDNTDKSDKVYVAIELVNNSGTAFNGIGKQIIPAGGKFYLVGELKVAANAEEVPVNGNIFYKDYRTKLNLTLSAESISRAYNDIPDLRSSTLELGFSVDLEWQEGLTFDVTL